MLKTLSLTVALCSIMSVAVMAQQGGTRAERAACSADVRKFCKRVMNQGDLVVLGCLQQNRRAISRACSRVLASHGQ
jgi:hypothetical protein